MTEKFKSGRVFLPMNIVAATVLKNHFPTITAVNFSLSKSNDLVEISKAVKEPSQELNELFKCGIDIVVFFPFADFRKVEIARYQEIKDLLMQHIVGRCYFVTVNLLAYKFCEQFPDRWEANVTVPLHIGASNVNESDVAEELLKYAFTEPLFTAPVVASNYEAPFFGADRLSKDLGTGKNVVAIVVHDRIENIERWVHCWKQCDQTNTQLVIVNNHYGNEGLCKSMIEICERGNVLYVGRNGLGFDIGAFQDVCKGSLPGFPEFDKLLWLTDDVMPMKKDFIHGYFAPLNTPQIGCVCMDRSIEVKDHIRTAAFAMRKETLSLLSFPADPVTTKAQCYDFEHLTANSLLEQINKLGMITIQENYRHVAALWDSNYHAKIDRQIEHNMAFPYTPDELLIATYGNRYVTVEKYSNASVKKNKVLIICPIYQMYPQIISSLICQSHGQWELLLVHNGPCEDKELLATIQKYCSIDERVKFFEHPEYTGKWGHALRQWALNEIKAGRQGTDAEFVVITNADNYHMPAYLEYMVAGFTSPSVVATYCSDMIHNYIKWQNIPCRIEVGYVDCAGVMIRKEAAAETGWNDVDSHSSDFTYFEDVMKKYPTYSFEKVQGCLLVHN